MCMRKEIVVLACVTFGLLYGACVDWHKTLTQNIFSILFFAIYF